jgi:hypothetical protein
MADKDLQTDPQNPAGTGGGEPTPPTATPPNNGGGSATGNQNDQFTTPDGFKLVKEDDYNKLVSQRDGNHQQASNSDAFVEQIARERAIDSFLKENQQKYPDLTADDLSHISSPEDLDTEAARIQRRLEDHTQNKLLELENAKPPKMTQEEKQAKLDELAKNGSPASLEKALALELGR